MSTLAQKNLQKKWHKTPTSRQDHITAYVMLLPSLVLLAIFVIWPLITTLEKSLTDYNFYNATYVGPKNYYAAFKSCVFSNLTNWFF